MLADNRIDVTRHINQQEWRQFTDHWAKYKTIVLVPNSYTDTQMAHKLCSCCCTELQSDLRYMSISSTSTESNILTKIKDLVVNEVNPLQNLCDYFRM